jgi:hypothetical protein
LTDATTDPQAHPAGTRSAEVPFAPGWRVIEHRRQPTRGAEPQLALPRRPAPPRPIVHWVTGGLASVAVLALALSGYDWPASSDDRSDAAPAPSAVVGDIDPLPDPLPQASPTPSPPPQSALRREQPGDPAAQRAASGPAFEQPEDPAAALAAPRPAPEQPEDPPAAIAAPGPAPEQPEDPAAAIAAPGPATVQEASVAKPAATSSVSPRRGDQRVSGAVPIPVLRPAPGTGPEIHLAAGRESADRLAAGIALIGLAEDDPGSLRGAAPGGGIRVFIHHTAAHARDAATAARLAEYLSRRGFVVADIRPVDMRIGAAGLRYFFDQDRDPSRRLLEELDWFFQGQSQWALDQASDFTHYTPKPRRGNVELWLPTS